MLLLCFSNVDVQCSSQLDFAVAFPPSYCMHVCNRGVPVQHWSYTFAFLLALQHAFWAHALGAWDMDKRFA